ncbi:MAG: iron-containing alcohol dehydrogenase [Desulfobacterales bacterium]|nr:iron-containing alcohol dehydrogenase [Desulfobacterales bacterium]
MCNSLELSDVSFELFLDITPNPRAEEVMQGVDIYENNGCDVIVAVGGGSAIDCAKGIGISSSNKKHVLEFEGVDNVDIPGPPLICIPTTAGSSADVSQFAIINNRDKRVKIAIISKTTVPDVALIDPETTTTMDNYLTACTGMDAMVHAIEAYVSSASSPIFDLHALEAVRLIHSYLISAIEYPQDIISRDKMMLGSLEAGLAFSNASLGAVHAMAHSLGGFLDVPHGECNSILLDHVIAYNYEVVPERYDRIGHIMGIDTGGLAEKERKDKLLKKIRKMKKQAGITKTLKDIGLHKSDIKSLAQKAIHDSCIFTNPRKPSLKELEVIYEDAL